MSKITAKKLNTFLGHNDSIYTLEQIDQDRFVSAGGDGMIIIWDLNNPDEGEVMAKVKGSVYAMVFDHEKKVLFVGENNQGIHAIDLNSKKEINSIHLGEVQLFDLKIINDQIWAALSSGEVIVLNADLKILKRKKYISERVRSIDELDNAVAIGFSDNRTRIIDIDTMEVIHELIGHTNSVFSSKFHPSGKYLITVGRDAHIRVWDTNAAYIQRESIAAHLYTINHVVFIKEGRYFVTASMDKSIKLWDAHNFQLLKVLDKHRHAGHGNSVNKLLWMNYHDLLVTCSDDRAISVWDINFIE